MCCRYGLAWSPFLEGHLLSGSDDAQICLWDITGTTKGMGSLQARDIFTDHGGVVEVQLSCCPNLGSEMRVDNI